MLSRSGPRAHLGGRGPSIQLEDFFLFCRAPATLTSGTKLDYASILKYLRGPCCGKMLAPPLTASREILPQVLVVFAVHLEEERRHTMPSKKTFMSVSDHKKSASQAVRISPKEHLLIVDSNRFFPREKMDSVYAWPLIEALPPPDAPLSSLAPKETLPCVRPRE